MGKIKQDLPPPRPRLSHGRERLEPTSRRKPTSTAQTTLPWRWNRNGAPGRLRFLVSTELREKFDRQRYLLNQAIWHGDLEAVRREASRMTSAWQALDAAAAAAGASCLSPEVWEVVLEDGTVAAIVPDTAATKGAMPDGRRMAVYTLEEIGRLLSHYPQIAEAKTVWPGATVEAVRRPSDPLDAFPDTKLGLDDPIEDPISTYGASEPCEQAANEIPTANATLGGKPKPRKSPTPTSPTARATAPTRSPKPPTADTCSIRPSAPHSTPLVRGTAEAVSDTGPRSDRLTASAAALRAVAKKTQATTTLGTSPNTRPRAPFSATSPPTSNGSSATTPSSPTSPPTAKASTYLERFYGV